MDKDLIAPANIEFSIFTLETEPYDWKISQVTENIAANFLKLA